MAGQMQVGDFSWLLEYSVKTYKKCRDCTAEYPRSNLASDARQLANNLEDLHDLVKSYHLVLTPETEAELLERGAGCRDVLADVTRLLDKYNSLSIETKRTWSEWRWDEEGVRDLKTRLPSNVTLLSTFYGNLIHSPQMEIEQAIRELANDYRGGHRDATSLVAIARHESSDSEGAWYEITRDLKDLGVFNDFATENRSYIVEWIVGAISDSNLVATAVVVPGPSTVQSVATGPPPVSSPETLPTYDNLGAAIAGHSIPGYTPPAYPHHDPGLRTTALEAIHHWNEREWVFAEKDLQRHLSSVLGGASMWVSNTWEQPDSRVLQHLLGVAASYQGHFHRAKTLFEGVLIRPAENSRVLDEGDIAAAQWLGDTCLVLNQPMNATLAYALALEGYDNRREKENFDRVLSDLQAIDARARGLTALRHSFEHENVDRTSIFVSATLDQKNRLIASALKASHHEPAGSWSRRQLGITISEGVLLQPPTSDGKKKKIWPLEYDPLFHVKQTLALNFKFLEFVKSNPTNKFNPSSVSTAKSLTSKLDYSTPNGAGWLLTALKKGLDENQIEYKEAMDGLTCRLVQQEDQIVYYEAVPIRILKLPLKKVYGIRVGLPELPTRYVFKSPSPSSFKMKDENSEERKEVVRASLVSVLKEFLEGAERTDELPEPPEAGPSEDFLQRRKS